MPPEFFDTAEVVLNEGDQSWGNLGLWRDNNSYSEACRNLAVALGALAGLDQNSHVFDAGFGCGDQLLLWLEQFRVASLQGVNLSAVQTQRAVELLESRGHGHYAEHLMQGDISDTRLWPAAGAESPTRILCLDSAYHFPHRRKFFAHAARSLDAGGKLCLTDFVLADAAHLGLRALPLRGMLRASRIPRDNIATLARYSAELEDAGFGSFESRDISEDVMLGFAGWWSSYRQSADYLPTRSRLKYAVTARFLHWACRNRVLRYVMISAQRQP